MNNKIQNPVTIIMLNHHQNHDDKSFSIIKIMTGHHQNHDEMSDFRAFFIIKIMTFLSNHMLGGLAGRGCQPTKGQGSKRFAAYLVSEVCL